MRTPTGRNGWHPAQKKRFVRLGAQASQGVRPAARWRASTCAQMARLAASLLAPQARISSSVRQQPSHQPLTVDMRQTLTQGDGTAWPG